MAVDNRPFKSKEQDGQGNEVIIRDQQLVEQGTATTMASGAYFETRDVDDRPVKIPRDNMMNIVLECIGIILNDSSRNLGTNVQKALGLQGNTVGHSTVADFASVLGVGFFSHTDVQSQARDCNNLREPGTYRTYNNANTPTSADSRIGLLIVFKGSDYIVQLFMAKAGSFYVRLSKDDGSSWEAWKGISLTTV